MKNLKNKKQEFTINQILPCVRYFAYFSMAFTAVYLSKLFLSKLEMLAIEMSFGVHIRNQDPATQKAQETLL